MAAMVKTIKKGFIRYAQERFSDEAEQIIHKAEALYPVLYAKAPDIGGPENVMAYNLDLLILSASFYETSSRRIDGKAITECVLSRISSQNRTAITSSYDSDERFLFCYD